MITWVDIDHMTKEMSDKMQESQDELRKQMKESLELLNMLTRSRRKRKKELSPSNSEEDRSLSS